VAVVLAGGGARGAYEIGALAALLPKLTEGERPDIVVGTSVGAINAAYLAANAEKPPEQLAEGGLALWRGIRYDQVLRPLVSAAELGRLGAYLGEVLGLPRARVKSVLDPAPLSLTLDELIEFRQIHANVAAGHLLAAAVVATSAVTNLSVVFHDGGPDPKADPRRGISYIKTELTEAHVRASAAIPVLFPAVPIPEVEPRRWYFDGGTRLNTPIKPALALGARRVVVIALNSLVIRHDREEGPRPDALDGAGQLIQAVLVDPLVNDVHTLATMNELLADDSEEKMRAHEARTRRRRIPYMLIAPEDPDEIGRVAAEIYAQHYGSPLDLIRSPNLASLGHLVNARTSPSHGDLLSYLFFAEEFIERLIELGRRDAERWLADDAHDHGRWQIGPLPSPEQTEKNRTPRPE
jgi:NTE family protein